MEIVHRFAEALDHDDYDDALRLLEADARYQRDMDFIQGASPIVASFRRVSEWGRRNLDALEYCHEINDETSLLEISFIDILRSEGDELKIRHSVHVTISENGLIEQLLFIRPPGEKEILDAFFGRHRLKPPS